MTVHNGLAQQIKPTQTFELDEAQLVEPMTEQRVVGVAKVACVALAAITLVFSVVDFADIRTAGEISNLWHLRVRPALASAVAGTDAEIRSNPLPHDGDGVVVKTNLDRMAVSAIAPHVLPDGVKPQSRIPMPTPAPARAAATEQPRRVSLVRLNVPSDQRLPSFMALASASNEDLASAPPLDDIAAPMKIETPKIETPSSAAALGVVPLPRPAPAREAEAHDPTPAELLGLDINPKERARAERCLANAVYFESRSEPLRGQFAVAQVVMNRVFSPFYPKDVCSVVYQNANRHLSCQFTFACDGKSKAILDRGAWARASRIAKQTLDGKLWVPEVAKSTHYHALYVRPAWIHEMRRLFKTGVHLFYRPYNWGDGSDEQGWVKPPKMAAAAFKP